VAVAVDVAAELQAGVDRAVRADGGRGVAAVAVVVVGRGEGLLRAVGVLRQQREHVGVRLRGQGDDQGERAEGGGERGSPRAGEGMTHVESYG